MINKKFLSGSIVAVSIAVGVVFYSCNNKDDLTAAEDGKNLAGELCDCFTKAGNDETKLKCISDFESKRDKWRDEADAKAFEDAFNLAITSCANDPYQWKLSHTALIAAAEFCALATQHPDGDMMILAPLYGKYEVELNSGTAFLNPFFGALMACSPDSDWILCIFGMTDFCSEDELTDEEIIALATIAVPEFCDYFTANPDADQNSMLTSEVASKYSKHFPRAAFTGALLHGLGSCSTTPHWFICLMTGGQAPGCN